MFLSRVSPAPAFAVEAARAPAVMLATRAGGMALAVSALKRAPRAAPTKSPPA